MAYHTIRAAFTVTGIDDRDDALRHLEDLIAEKFPTTTHDPDSTVEAWWIAEDDRLDGSDEDSCVFVPAGSQNHYDRLVGETREEHDYATSDWFSKNHERANAYRAEHSAETPKNISPTIPSVDEIRHLSDENFAERVDKHRRAIIEKITDAAVNGDVDVTILQKDDSTAGRHALMTIQKELIDAGYSVNTDITPFSQPTYITVSWDNETRKRV